MRKAIVLLLFVVGSSLVATAGPGVPELDPASGGSALALIGGGLLMLRARRTR